MNKWPAIIILIVMCLNTFLTALLHGEQRPPYNGARAFLDLLMTGGLLYWGGFFDVLLK